MLFVLKGSQLFIRNVKFNSLRSLRLHSFKAAHISNKKLVEVKGEHSYRYLQGLITNDIRHLYLNRTTSVHLDCIYAFVLHPNGRIFADIFIYNPNANKDTLWNGDDTDPKLADPQESLLIECHEQISDKLVRHLKLHRLKSKVDINYHSDFNIWSIFPNLSKNENEKLVLPKIEAIRTTKGLLTADPRLKNHYRCLLPKDGNITAILENLEKNYDIKINQTSLEDYTNYRYESGIGEGCLDHPDGSSFPLECNGDFLHGISFHKGCYVGQELTARVHHTGVVRKRLLPIKVVPDDIQENLENFINCDIVSLDDDKKLGKIRNGQGSRGLGLLYVNKIITEGRVRGCLKALDGKTQLESWKPFWWPNEVKLVNK